GESLEWVTYAFDRYDPTLGWRPAPNFSSSTVRTNAQGIRADRDISRARTPGRGRIVALGDSYTWGEEVANDETYPAQLEKALPDTDVLNFGVHGYGIDQATLRLRDEALAFVPDLVILGFIEDDVARDALTFRSFAKPRFELQDRALRLTHVPVPTPELVLAETQALPHLYLSALARLAMDDLLDRTRFRPIEARESWRVTEALFDEDKRLCEAAGARFVLAYFPSQVDVQVAPAERLAADWAERAGSMFVDLRPAFAALPETEWRAQYRGVHWSPAGNRRVSQLLRDEIVQRKLLPASPAPSHP
ncbi:MAG: SGNH/GDSL hydrolase family protein, partial [Solirubrobacteraceae bacterium]